MSVELIGALRAAVEAAPGNPGVRNQLAEALLAAGEGEEALLHARAVLGADPAHLEGLRIASEAAEAVGNSELASGYQRLREALDHHATGPGVMLVGPDRPEPQVEADVYLEARPKTTLTDVGGMEAVKRELQRSFLGPMRQPELREMYGAELGGGLMLYGPPGCGKTLLARAIAGELGASFIALGLQDVLDMYLGESERKLHSAFEEARRRAPCVLFFDEVDAIGQKRGQLKGSAGRNVVNQLLSEMDGLGSGSDDGVFVLAATNHPWDVDAALRRAGRFDRTLLVLPPDAEARRTIFELQMAGRPIDRLDYGDLAKRTELYSGADIALVCKTATANVMASAADTGEGRPIIQKDLLGALRETKPSIRPWFDLAYNFAAFANSDGTYDQLLSYIRKHRLA